MSQVSFQLNGRNFSVACDAGQEGHILGLAASVDERLQPIAQSAGVGHDSQVYALTMLVLADELHQWRSSKALQPPRLRTRPSWLKLLSIYSGGLRR